MEFNTLDTEATYRRLLETPDAETRADIFRRELVEPFRGIVDIFGGAGGDGLAQFGMWGMSPEQYAGDKREHMRGVLDALAQADAWNRAARALHEGYAAFEKYANRIPLEKITFGLLTAEMAHMPQARGYTGFGGIPGWIMTVYGVPDAYNLARVEACTVH
ncbi:MAG: DUF2268 domain-containing protein, partial [Anaerolineae bacterium]|nr:DUF2268 domain-containing protein [Anaerolineae bacterium]